MPSITDDNTVKAIAREWIATKRNKTQTLLNVGYSAGYADNGLGHKIFGNVRVKQAIDTAEADIAAETRDRLLITRAGQNKKLEHAHDKADTLDNIAGMVSAIKEQNNICGLQVQIIDDKREPEQSLTTAEEIAELELRLATLKRSTGVALALAE